MAAWAKALPIRAILTRGIPASFEHAICDFAAAAGSSPINVALAQRQHDAYTRALHVPEVKEIISIPPDERFPDCVFIEDAVVVHGGAALVTHPGAQSRRGEGEPLPPLLASFGLDVTVMEAPSMLDGGDVLTIDDATFVGLSTRTNMEGVRDLERCFAPQRVFPLKMSSEALHLKSIMSYVGPDLGLVYDASSTCSTEHALFVQSQLERDIKLWPMQGIASVNMLRVGQRLLFTPGSKADMSAVQEMQDAAPHVEFVAIDYSELQKADAALTCCSVVIPEWQEACLSS